MTTLQQDLDLACQLLRKLATAPGLALSEADQRELRALAQKLEACPVRATPPPPEVAGEKVPLRAVMWSDGACRGNPGIAGVGAIIKSPEGKVLATVAEYIGRTTNNVAEYRALIRGAETAWKAGVTILEIRADSQLMIEQLKGNYKVKNENLKALYVEAKKVLNAFQRIELKHVPREENTEADELANRGIDAR